MASELNENMRNTQNRTGFGREWSPRGDRIAPVLASCLRDAQAAIETIKHKRIERVERRKKYQAWMGSDYLLIK